MPDQTPMPSLDPRPGWTPTGSTLNGALIGGAMAQVLIATSQHFFGVIDPYTVGAVNTLCVAIIGYFFIDGGRK